MESQVIAKDRVDIYIDGSCDNKKQDKGGGIGVVMLYGSHVCKVAKGPYIPATSARMEVMALLEALKILTRIPKSTIIYSDSKYVVDTVNKWLEIWKDDFFIKRKKNGDLWLEIKYILRKTMSVNVVWVRGHNNNKYNELADELANEGRLSNERYEVVKLSE